MPRPVVLFTLVLGSCQPLQRPAVEPASRPAAEEERYRRAAALRGEALVAMEGEAWPAAIEALAEIERLLPGNLLPPLNLTVAHRRDGDFAAAAAAAARASRLAPSHPLLLQALAHLERNSGGDWLPTLGRYRAAHPRDARPLFLATRWHAEDGAWGAAATAAEEAAMLEPENLVLLVERLVTAAADDRAAVWDALDAVEDRLGGFDGSAAAFAAEIREALEQGRPARGTAPQTQMIRNILRPTELYRQHLKPLIGEGSVDDAYFIQHDFIPPLPKSIQGGLDIDVAFEALPAPGGRWRRPVPFAGPEKDELVALDGDGRAVRLTWDGADWRGETPIAGMADRLWSTLDFDQDGISDLLFELDGRLRLAPGVRAAPPGGNGTLPTTLEDAIEIAGVRDLEGVVPADLDHDGDLDLLLLNAAATRYVRNNGDGSWQEEPSPLPLTEPALDIAVADFDDDGDFDLAAATGSSVRLFLSDRPGRLSEATGMWIPEAAAGTDRLQVADFDSDGRFDLLLAGRGGLRLALQRNGTFAIDPLPVDDPTAAVDVGDFDNDGDRDLLLIPPGRSAILLRNSEHGFASEPLSPTSAEVERSIVGDYDGDGDLDIAAAGGSAIALWRNDGGNLNHWLRLRLRGKTENNAKNHSQGFGSRIEARAGTAYQQLLANGRVNHLGLGASRRLDVLRVIWTNGLAQSWAALAADQTLDEEQVLKGSCPFLYSWNGERFEFVTDLMWKSPLGMSFPDGTPAPHQSAVDFVRIPASAIAPVGGTYWLQVTEELWETVYVDRQQLLLFDAPAELEMVLDERFTLPPHPNAPALHWLRDARSPALARDHLGRDVTAVLTTRDGRHVGDLPVGRYQGVTDEHELRLAFDDVPTDRPVRLVLTGWIFPTDTSINVALSQHRSPTARRSRIELRARGDSDRAWRELDGGFAMPAGKNKSVVVDLTGRLPSSAFEVRISTSLQIYWDSARVAVADPAFEPRRYLLDPSATDLHYRGFSRLYRNEPSGPHLFDYRRVSTEPRFRDLRGRYTRFGEVDELLAATDDRVVVMNAGDELTVQYDTDGVPPPPPGWRRHFVLFTDGWVKDGDLNTAASDRVGPLPFHAMTGYPPQTEPAYVDGGRWLDRYQTRRVDDRPFAAAVREAEVP